MAWMTESGRWGRLLGEWIQSHDTLLAWTFALSLLFFVGSLIVIPVLIARIRTDYFVAPAGRTDNWRARYPLAHLIVRAARNVLGVVLLLAGIVMMVLPGQGIITILVALSLLDFPGKRQLETRLVRQPKVSQAINWIRKRAGRPPIQPP